MWRCWGTGCCSRSAESCCQTRLADTPLIAVKIGAILAVTLNWSVFQTLVFNLDANAPLEIGKVISRPMAAGGPSLVEDPMQGVQTAYDELNADAQELTRKASQTTTPGAGPVVLAPQGNEASTAAGLRHAATALLGSTAGVLVIATGVLTAVGPVFIALFLFEATRGFFIGWVRALVGAMLTPMVCWIATSLMLVVLAPRIDLLAQQRAAQQISLDTAAAASAVVLIFAAAQAVLIVAVLLVAGGFHLGRRTSPARDSSTTVRDTDIVPVPIEARTRAQMLAANLQRTPATYSREYSTAAAALAGAAARESPGDSGPADNTSTRPVRLGETYRRGVAMRDRDRLGLAGRA